MLANEQPYAVTSKSYTAVAINTASKAGEWVKSKLGQFTRLDMKTAHSDLVTEVDKGAETLIRNLISTHFPRHAILGEEGMEPGADAYEKAVNDANHEPYVWIIDPIDGTTNFVHGFPFFSVSIALAHKGEIIVGVIYDPNRDEMFVAEKGKGAYLRGHRMLVSEEEKLSQCLLGAGFPSSSSLGNMKAIGHLIPQVRNIRTTGSAALHLAYVAAGRLSGFFEAGLSVWDIAAGALLVQEAGGRITDLQGAPYTLATREIVATNGRVHDELQQALAESGI